MQIDVFAQPQEVVSIAELACIKLNASIYALCAMEVHPLLIPASESLSYADRGCSLLISASDLTAKRVNVLVRDDLTSTVAMRFGRVSDSKIESSSFTADASSFSRKFADAVRAFLKREYLTDLVNVETNERKVGGIKFYYSNSAAQSGKVFSQFLEQRTAYRPANG